jgi:SAM-dependent methyltransferase
MNINYAKWHEFSGTIFKKFGIFSDLKMIENPYEYASHYISNCQKVLDLGAGAKVAKSIVRGVYKSLDNDPTHDHDYSHIDQINEKFDGIIANQFFEHLSFEDGIAFFEKVANVLMPGGVLVVTIPNICHPTSWHLNWDHKAFWGYWDIGVMMEINNVEVIDIVRYRKRPHEIYELTEEERKTIELVSKIFSMDYCRYVMVVGVKGIFES